MLPATRGRDRLPPPHPRRPVEVEEHSSSASSAMLEHKVSIQQDRLNLRQETVVAVQVSPPRLHHPDLRLREVMNHLHHPLSRRHKVRIEDRHKLALRYLEPLIKGSRLI